MMRQPRRGWRRAAVYIVVQVVALMFAEAGAVLRVAIGVASGDGQSVPVESETERALHNPGCSRGLKPPLSSSDLAM